MPGGSAGLLKAANTVSQGHASSAERTSVKT